MRKFCAFIATMLLGLCVAWPPATATGGLVSSSPASGAQVSRAPETVRLTFDRPVLTDAANSVKITGPDGAQWQEGALGIDQNVMDVVLRPLDPEGDYVVGYTVHLGDPAPLTGQFKFTLAKGLGAAVSATGWQTWASLAGIVLAIAALLTTAGVLQARRR